MKEKILAFLNKLLDYFLGIIQKVVEVIYNLFVALCDLFFAFLSGLKAQVSTAIGSIIFAVFLFLVYDVYKKGEFGAISFIITTLVAALNSIINTLGVTGAQVFWIIIIALVTPVVLKLSKK